MKHTDSICAYGRQKEPMIAIGGEDMGLLDGATTGLDGGVACSCVAIAPGQHRGCYGVHTQS